MANGFSGDGLLAASSAISLGFLLFSLSVSVLQQRIMQVNNPVIMSHSFYNDLYAFVYGWCWLVLPKCLVSARTGFINISLLLSPVFFSLIVRLLNYWKKNYETYYSVVWFHRCFVSWPVVNMDFYAFFVIYV